MWIEIRIIDIGYRFTLASCQYVGGGWICNHLNTLTDTELTKVVLLFRLCKMITIHKNNQHAVLHPFITEIHGRLQAVWAERRISSSNFVPARFFTADF